MCFSNNYIEQQASKMTDEIRSQSLYKFIGVDYFRNETNSPSQHEHTNKENTILLKDTGLISKIFLEDKKGTLYTIEPNMNGLRFAKGEISYSKYKRSQRKNDLYMFVSFFLITVFLVASMFLLSKLI